MNHLEGNAVVQEMNETQVMNEGRIECLQKPLQTDLWINLPEEELGRKGVWGDHAHYLQLSPVLPLMGRCLHFSQVPLVCRQNQDPARRRHLHDIWTSARPHGTDLRGLGLLRVPRLQHLSPFTQLLH